MFGKPMRIPDATEAIPGRDEAIKFNPEHYVHGRSMVGPFPSQMESVIFGLGCFWGAERKFWNMAGVHTTAAGYAAGTTKNPTYQEVCSGMTGHNEVVLVVYDPGIVTFETLLRVFWEAHNPTQGMRQGNDRGTQYRSGIYTYTDEQRKLAVASMHAYQRKLQDAGHPAITTEIEPVKNFYYAEEYHQQYLEKNPAGYCGLGGTGISCS